MEKEYPIVSVMIATYNSEWILEKPLKALRNQTYPQDKLKIMIVDGGSRDGTFDIAHRYGCDIIKNPNTDPVSAKRIGLEAAEGKYLLSVDHDEVLINPDSVKNRVDAMLKYPHCKVAFCSGYRCPEGCSGLNEYVSEFGDPFSLFYYRFPKGHKHFYRALQRRATLIEDRSDYAIFRFDKGWERVLVEVLNVATIIDLDYFRTIYSENNNPDDLEHLFYDMIEDGYKDTVLEKNDPLDHYSVDSISSYLPKLKWRIINNVHYPDQASNGFVGRQSKLHSSSVRKYLFLFYTISTIIPFIEGVYYSLSRRNGAFMLHPFLCWFILIHISYQYGRRLLGRPAALMTYNGEKLGK